MEREQVWAVARLFDGLPRGSALRPPDRGG